MRDRIPTQVLENGALRYGVYDESGNFLRHEYLALDDAPTDTGTDLSKATLLQDSTEVSLFGAAADRTVDDAFKGLAGQLKLIMGDMASITVTLKDSAGTAIPGVLVQGILSESGQAVYSNDSGVAAGYISEGSQVVKVTGYADIVDYSETLSVTKGTSITKTITLTTRNFLKITSSQSVKFSGNVETIDFSIGGGGGGGGYGLQYSYYYIASGGGGGGGYAVTAMGVSVTPETLYPAVVGAGGAKGANGGTSSFMGNTAAGGAKGEDAAKSSSSGTIGGFGGEGNGNGGAGVNGHGASSSYRTSVGNDGTAGTQTIFTSFIETSPYGGGGGSGGALAAGGAGGSPGGGNGGGSSPTESPRYGSNGTDTLGGGGGSGYVENDDDNSDGTRYIYDPGKGGSGCVAIRMHLKSAA